MIKELKKNMVKCHNCGKLWTFEGTDVQTMETSVYPNEVFTENYIKCPKCKNHLTVYYYNDIWRG